MDREGSNLIPGMFFPLPTELRVKSQIEAYERAKDGWSLCPLGYHMFAVTVSSGAKIVIPGLILDGEKRPRKLFADYKVLFKKEIIKAIAQDIVEENERVERLKNRALLRLVHDLRALSGEILHAAETMRTDVENNNFRQLHIDIGTVLASQQMLSMRIDLLDFSAGQTSLFPPERIPVFKKVDKVQRCFQPRAAVKDVRIELLGTSFGFAYGRPVFELIPFVIIENAMKYAPSRTKIIINVLEDVHMIRVDAQSYGPEIRQDEINRIFDRGFRGAAAKVSGVSGSGVGLSTVKMLLNEQFNGDISVTQNPVPYIIDGAKFWSTTFSFWVPRAA